MSFSLPKDSGRKESMVGSNWVLPPAHFRKGFALVLEIVCKFILYKLTAPQLQDSNLRYGLTRNGYFGVDFRASLPFYMIFLRPFADYSRYYLAKIRKKLEPTKALCLRAYKEKDS